jgi:hypothetical protein
MARPILNCCVPYLTAAGWLHSKSCDVPLNRKQKVRIHTRHPAGSAHLIETVQAGGATSVAIWREHPEGCCCLHCQYVEHHKDDDDDRSFDRPLEVVSPRGRI